MEKTSKFLIAGMVLSCTISIIAVFIAFVSYEKVSKLKNSGGDITLGNFNNKIEKPSSVVIKNGPVSFARFSGKPTAVDVDLTDGKKVIELKGHDMEDAKKIFESTLESDTSIKKVIIDSNTRVYRITKGSNEVSEIPFDHFSVSSKDETYIVAYEAKEGESITDATSANTVSIYNR